MKNLLFQYLSLYGITAACLILTLLCSQLEGRRSCNNGCNDVPMSVIRERRRQRRLEIDRQKKQEPTKWALLLFMVGDQKLEPYMNYNLRQVAFAGLPDDMALRLYTCVHLDNGTHHLQRLSLSEHTLNTEESSITTTDDAELLTNALTDLVEHNAEHYGVIIWAHGFGPGNLTAQPHNTNNLTFGHYLSDSQVRKALQQALKNHPPKQLDFIGFDACHMATIEVAASLRPFARYMIASEQTIRALGWPYHRILGEFYPDNKEPELFAKAIIDAYGAYYKKLTNDYTLSIVDLAHLDRLLENVDTIANQLRTLLTKNRTLVTQLFTHSQKETVRFEDQLA